VSTVKENIQLKILFHASDYFQIKDRNKQILLQYSKNRYSETKCTCVKYRRSGSVFILPASILLASFQRLLHEETLNLISETITVVFVVEELLPVLQQSKQRRPMARPRPEDNTNSASRQTLNPDV